jgi:enoyl-CoA hydratase/carnithine racemase
MDYATIKYELSDHIATITLNRPERLNAFNMAMTRELKHAWAQVKADPEVRCVIVTGAGEKAFCTGVDVSGHVEDGEFDIADDPNAEPDFLTMTAIQNHCWKPVITAINGMVVGGGLHFIAGSDINICAEHATVFDTHVAVGKVAGLEPVELLRRIPFEAVAKLALLGGAERMSAAEARAVGLVSEVVPAGQLMSRARELAGHIAACSPAAVAATKRAMWQSLDMGLDEGLRHAWSIICAHDPHPDNHEGPLAKYEKRAPVWQPYEHPD